MVALLPESAWSKRHPAGNVVPPVLSPQIKSKTMVQPPKGLVPSHDGMEPQAFQRMREARLLSARLEREKQEVKEGKKNEVSEF